jgi:Rad3-related DNA helicase
MKKATLGKLAGMDLRPTQANGIEFIKEARKKKKKYIALQAPTGIGKTCLGFESTQIPFFYICSSKTLQDQAARDYPEAVLLKGKNNYNCPNYGTADLCVQNTPCGDCEFQEAKKKAMGAAMTILNFHYFMYTANFTKEFQYRNIIIDEADDLESVIVGFISFEFTDKQLQWLGIMPEMPEKKTTIKIMPRWIELRHREIAMVQQEMKDDIKELQAKARWGKLDQKDRTVLSKWKALTALAWKMRFLLQQDNEGKLLTDWIYRYDEVPNKKITIKPIWLTRELTERFFLRHGKDFLFMSATLPAKEVFCGLYGFKAEEVAFKDLPDSWESDKRQVIYRGAYKLTYKDKNKETYDKIKNAVRKILDEQKGRGVIHCVSYELGRIIAKLNEDRLITHTAKNRTAMFQHFKDTEGAVWVSPSSIRGIDLPGELCEFIIWLKAPFLNLKDPQTNKRYRGSGKFGKIWYSSDACQSIIQGCGRGFRSPDDYCTVYLLDKQIGGLLLEQQKLFPMWFRELVHFE